MRIVAEFPDERRVAEAYSQGALACLEVPGFSRQFLALLKHIEAQA
jgi:hypothetical protein